MSGCISEGEKTESHYLNTGHVKTASLLNMLCDEQMFTTSRKLQPNFLHPVLTDLNNLFTIY